MVCICGHAKERHIIPLIRLGDQTHKCLDCGCLMFRREMIAPPDHFMPADKLAKVVALVQYQQSLPDSGWDVWSAEEVQRQLLWAWPIDFRGGWQDRDNWLKAKDPEELAAIVLAPVMA